MTTNWIEKDLEKYIAKNFSVLVNAMMRGYASSEEFVFLGTQIPCEYGIIDMLFFRRETIFIVEFKSVMATEKTIGQASRYANAIKHADIYSEMNRLDFEAYGADVEILTQTIIIAPSFTPDAIKAADWSFIAERETDGTFRLHHAPLPPRVTTNEKLENSIQPYIEKAQHLARIRHFARNNKEAKEHLAQTLLYTN